MNKAISGPLCILQRRKMGTDPTLLFFSDLHYCEQYLSRDWRLQMKSATYTALLLLNSLWKGACGPTGRIDSGCQDALSHLVDALSLETRSDQTRL